MRPSLIALSVLTILPVAGGAIARETPECRIGVVRAVTDDAGRRWRVGEVAPATFIRRDGGRIVYCEDHGACLPHSAGGIVVTRPIDCRPGKVTGPGYIALDPDPRVMGEGAARQMLARRRAEERLSALGFSNAGAGSLAEAYAGNPYSRNGRLVARALAGSRAAVAQLQRVTP